MKKKNYKNKLPFSLQDRKNCSALSHWQATISWGQVSKNAVAREVGENTDGNSKKKRNEDKESTLLIGDMKLHGKPVPLFDH